LSFIKISCRFYNNLLMIDFIKEQLEERLNMDYKKVLSLMTLERLTIKFQLGMKIVNHKLNL
jgi:hypothetical protein